MVVASQLGAAAAQRPLPCPLPERYAHAEACRPKLLDLGGGVARPRELNASPSALLEATTARLHAARFSIEVDRELAVERMLDFEWLVENSLEQARLDPYEHPVVPSPANLTPLIQRPAARTSSSTRVRPPPPQSREQQARTTDADL